MLSSPGKGGREGTKIGLFNVQLGELNDRSRLKSMDMESPRGKEIRDFVSTVSLNVKEMIMSGLASYHRGRLREFFVLRIMDGETS